MEGKQMSYFSNQSTRSKLTWAFGSLIALIMIILGLSYSALRNIRDAQAQLFEEDFRVVQHLNRLQINLNEARAAGLFLLLATGNPAEQTRLVEDIRATTRSNDSLFTLLHDLKTADPEFQDGLKALKSMLNEFVSMRDNIVIPASLAGKTAEANSVSLGVQATRFRNVVEGADRMAAKSEKRAAASVEKSKEMVSDSFWLIAITGFFALGFSAWVVALLNRNLAGPLRDLTREADKLAVGNLESGALPKGRGDEIGLLSEAFAQMTAGLRKTAAGAETIAEGDLTVPFRPQSDKDVLGIAFSGMADGLRKMVKEISEGVNVLASSASQILAGTSQLIAGASQTATAISETTTTVEEVRQTAQVASQKAKAVSATAEKAQQVSQAGKKAVEDTIQAMNRIRDQMESIADSTVKLGEQNQAIGEILVSVNEIAEQANLLSVNAAIEAARAGEHGKGFLVVAQEVRNMAEQSKNATRQVRSILNDIQKGIAKAVMAAEQGAKSVEGGVRQSQEASQSIGLLADTVQEAAQAAMQIAASSHQQLVGMDQVTSAMESIRLAGNQNVASVNQAGTAAKNINELGQRLKALVQRYKV
jgi:methyl-accepting chemotaxis protein